MSGLHDDPDELLMAVISFAPSGNVRIAMMQLLEFLSDLDPDEELKVDVRVIKEVLARGVIQLGWGVETEDCEHPDHLHDEEFAKRPYMDYGELSPEETLAQFRIELGLDDEKKEDK